MKSKGDANASKLLSAARLRFCVHLAAISIIASLFLTARSVAIASNLDRVVTFNIKSQTLESALVQFGIQARIQIVFASKVAMGQERTTALNGKYSGRQALERLLRGSNYRFVEEGNTAEIVPRDSNGSASSASYSGRADPAPVQRHTHPTTAPDPPKKGHNTTKLQEVVVTGSHIRGASISSPLIIITQQYIDRSGYTTVGDVVKSLPDNFGNTGPQTAIGSAENANSSLSGAPSPNLYGLGAGSTLTLVDGQRLATDATTGSSDISLIPLPVIDHIDVLTGGASAIYGSDAVAGVVNIVLKRNFSGSKTTLLGGGTADGGGTERYINQMIGKRWNTGGALFDFESDLQDPVLGSQREYTKSAAPVTTILPRTSRTSFFISSHQDIGPADAFITGLYTHRAEHAAYSNSPLVAGEANEVSVHEYAADGGVNVPLSSDWSISIVGDASEDRTTEGINLLGSKPRQIPIPETEGQLKSIEATTNGPIVKMQARTLRGAFGVGYRDETFNYKSGSSTETPGAHREIRYVYGELETPILRASERPWRRALMLDVSGRVEHYSDFGSDFVPKIGLVYVPFRSISFRGTWGKAFRAPPLFDIYDNILLVYLPLADPSSKTGVSDDLISLGGNRVLKPETSRSWTVGVEYASIGPDGWQAELTYFDTKYESRIGEIGNPYVALTDPLDSPFVTRGPSEAYVESLVNSASSLINVARAPLNPSNIPAVVNAGAVNVAEEDIEGVDVNVAYRKTVGWGQIEPFVGAAFLDLRQKVVPAAPETEISGEVFQPPKLRARGGISWSRHGLTTTGVVNYNGAETNIYKTGVPHVASWTTVDFSVLWRPKASTVFGRPTLTVSVQNAFNRDPPLVLFDQLVPGVHYDPLNANALGRVVRAGASWEFR